jgi:hypothetical protein
MRSEMVCSMSLYTTLIATSNFTPFWRCASLVIMDAFSLYTPDTFYSGACFFTGGILADLSIALENSRSSSAVQQVRLRRLIEPVKFCWPIILAVFALYVGSYPEEHEDHAAWSQHLHQWGDYYAPKRTIKFDLYVLI